MIQLPNSLEKKNAAPRQLSLRPHLAIYQFFHGIAPASSAPHARCTVCLRGNGRAPGRWEGLPRPGQPKTEGAAAGLSQQAEASAAVHFGSLQRLRGAGAGGDGPEPGRPERQDQGLHAVQARRRAISRCDRAREGLARDIGARCQKPCRQMCVGCGRNAVR